MSHFIHQALLKHRRERRSIEVVSYFDVCIPTHMLKSERLPPCQYNTGGACLACQCFQEVPVFYFRAGVWRFVQALPLVFAYMALFSVPLCHI